MRKGEERRAEIVRQAERLFCERGYEETSLEELLQALHLSKGGFYHHFPSKEALLLSVCEQKARAACEAARRAVEECPGGSAARIGALFDHSGFWQAEETDFLALLLKVGYRRNDLMLRQRLKESLHGLFLPLVDGIVKEGVASGEFRTPYPNGAGGLVLHLGLSLSDEIALRLAGDEPPDTAHILELIELYRYAIEQVLGAPAGSVELYQMRYMAEMCAELYETHRRGRAPDPAAADPEVPT